MEHVVHPAFSVARRGSHTTIQDRTIHRSSIPLIHTFMACLELVPLGTRPN